MIELTGARVTLGDTEILRGVDLKVANGEWVAVVGPNGAGKSTLLRFLAGLVGGRGDLLIDGRSAASLKRRERARLVALVVQTPTIPEGTTVADYVLLGRTPHIRPLAAEGPDDLAAVHEALEHLDLLEFTGRLVTTLSGGERQRVLVARALAQGAPIVLLDEPTSALDVGHQQQVLELIDELRRDHGLTVLTTMHDLTLAGQYADRLVLLDGGRVVVDGPADEVLTEDNLARFYGAKVRIVHDGGRPVVLPLRERREARIGHCLAAEGGRFMTDVPTEHHDPPVRRQASLVLVHTGDGKGKSSSAFGVVVRAVARDWPVAVVQFLKSGKWQVGEETVCRDRLGVDWWAIGEGFTWESDDLTEDQAVAAEAWQHARRLIEAGAHQLIVLDEITYPMNWGWISTDEVVEVLRARPEKVNVVLTGRDAPEALIEVADTVTEMRKVKHAYDSGVRAKKGIDY